MRAARPMPYGFAEVAERGQVFLMHEFHCSHNQIVRWRKELGIECHHRTMKRSVVMCDKYGRDIRRCKSIHAAARQVGGNTGNIWKALQGLIPTAYGYRWRYADDRLRTEHDA